MNPEPLTFAIPFHKGIEYLGPALHSVLAQTDPNWVAFVCDNASPERGVEALVRDIGKGRIGYVHNPRNLGMAGNFNRCLELAKTDLVTLLHADDLLHPTYCETFRRAAASYPQSAAFFCRAEIIGPDGGPWFSLADLIKDRISPPWHEPLILAGEPGLRAMLRANFIVAPTLCFRKSVLRDRRFTDRYRFVLDLELTTSLILDGECLVGLPDRCYRYRRHENTTELLTRSQLRFREESEFYDRMRAAADARGWRQCSRLAHQKRIIKLNVAYRTMKSAALMQVADVHRGLKMLRELYYNAG